MGIAQAKARAKLGDEMVKSAENQTLATAEGTLIAENDTPHGPAPARASTDHQVIGGASTTKIAKNCLRATAVNTLATESQDHHPTETRQTGIHTTMHRTMTAPTPHRTTTS